MQPVFAALVAAVYWRRRQNYGAHFVFSLHTHAFWFLALLATAALPFGLGVLGMPVIAAYTLLALRKVYGGGWPGAVLRGLLIALVYGLLLVMVVSGMALALAAG